ncbi:MAG: YcfL family protein [Opitutales bacterium]|nr:YcfL family protein [Opitutales bacterium]
MKTYIQKSFSTFFFSLLFVLSACSHKGIVGTVGKTDPQDKSAQPEVTKVEFGGELEKALEVVRITQGKADGNLLRMQVEIKNYSSTEVQFTHKLEWLDDEGFLVKDTSLVWKALMIRPGESKMIESIATRPGVSAFRLKIQPAKNP